MANGTSRFAYDASLNRFAQPATVPTNDPGSPHRRQTSINSTSRFSFASTASPTKQRSVDTTGSTDFPPPVSFDDLQASLAGDGRGFDAFQVPSAVTKVSNGNNDNGNTDYVRLKSSPRKLGASAAVGSLLSRDGSLRRQNSAAHRTNQLVGQVDPIAPPSAPVNTNTRRQSCFPVPNGDTSLHRQPRKSVGPGLLYTDLSERSMPIRKDGQMEPVIDSFHNSTRLGGALTGGRAPDTRADSNLTQSSSLGMPRNTKTKSLLPPPRLGRDLSLAALSSPDQTTPTAVGSARSPGRPLNNDDGTPSSDKRFSVLPNSVHATGLAARTISPTDARRLKRMSMMPTPPAIPYTPPTPHPDTPNSATHRTAPSPVVPRKSITPSSSRTTPDINRKSYSSGISNSSSTSYNSFINAAGPARTSQSISVSRLPTLKTRIDSAPATSEEEVPPVPAIPKAYESPKTEPDQPFFSAHKPSLPFDTGNATSSSNTEGLVPRRDDNGLPRAEAGRQRRGLTVDEYPVTEKKAGGTANINRRTLQPLRLPPLNLLPLSTPTAAKIAALYDGAGAMNLGAVTPPLQLGQHTTPTTPMTASKASFSRSFRDDDHIPRVPQMRSSSSHHTVRPDSAGYRAPSSISSHIPIAAERIGRKSISPFVSSSLPKTSGDFSYLRQISGGTADAQGAPGSRNPKLTGPRLQQERKGSKDSALGVEASSPAETSGSSFGTSLRRKLSLTRKRSISKSQSRTDIHVEPETAPKPPKHDNMPPPKLPASATWNGPLKPSPSPTRKQNPFRSGGKASNLSMAEEHERNRSSVWNLHGGSMTEAAPVSATATPTSKRTLRAQLENGPPQSSLSLREFLNEAKTSQLDRDDLTAEEEMRRLALRRKDTEIATKELDALRLRATAKERVGPSQALRVANLNIFERGEIIDYQDVYFCGTQDAQKHMGDLNAEGANFGYDDERGDYNIIVGDHLAYRYEIVDILGKGSFGQVARCIDHKTGGLMAIKIIRNKKRFHQQALVEVDILQRLREWVSRHILT